MTVLLNVLAWNSTTFCDAYIAYVFPIWVNTYGRLTGLFPFSVGEWLIVAGVVLVALAVVLGVVRVGMWLTNRCVAVVTTVKENRACTIKRLWKKNTDKDKDEHRGEQENGVTAEQKSGKNRILTWIKGFYRFFAWTVLIVCVIMTLNCTILYHASTFSQKYMGEPDKEYSLEQLLAVYNHVAEQCNQLSAMMERDDKGTIVCTGSVNSEGELVDMEDKAIEAMQQLGKTYSQLDGYYPRPKAMMFSDFMCQQYMCGYYFPFSMEANYNDVMYIMNKPASMCHELAHLRGYIYEDEANFISFLACVQSDDVVFQYAGYLSVLNYLGNDLYAAKCADAAAYEQAVECAGLVSVLPVVQQDNVFVVQEEWDRINGKALLDTETVDQVSDTFTDTTLKVNGVSDGMLSYNRVVRLLLQYYDGELF